MLNGHLKTVELSYMTVHVVSKSAIESRIVKEFTKTFHMNLIIIHVV